MKREEVLHLLTANKQSIRERGVKTLAVFGSAARDEITQESDIDILVEFSSDPGFDQYIELKFFLEELLGRSVDLITKDAVKPRVRLEIEKDILYVA
jgi:predicted nucleotidyltransferase